MVIELRHLVGLSFALVCLTLVGCGRPADPVVSGTATGTVTLDGQPLGDANLEFYPTASDANPPPPGVSDASGRFEVEIYKAGQYKVVVTGMGGAAAMEEGDPSQNVAEDAGPKIPTKYSDASTTPLTVDLAPGATVNLELSSTG